MRVVAGQRNAEELCAKYQLKMSRCYPGKKMLRSSLWMMLCTRWPSSMFDRVGSWNCAFLLGYRWRKFLRRWKLRPPQCSATGRRHVLGCIGRSRGARGYEHGAMGADEADSGRSPT